MKYNRATEIISKQVLPLPYTKLILSMGVFQPGTKVVFSHLPHDASRMRNKARTLLCYVYTQHDEYMLHEFFHGSPAFLQGAAVTET
jgi:hypothetical protein